MKNPNTAQELTSHTGSQGVGPDEQQATRRWVEGSEVGTSERVRVYSREHAQDSSGHSGGEEFAPLFSGDQTDHFRSEWDAIQASFVDDPRSAVAQADGLVNQSIDQLTLMFRREREKLEESWDRGDNVSTEDLRIAFHQYRSFFNRILKIY